MTVPVACPLGTLSAKESNPSPVEARKRRRQILQLHRAIDWQPTSPSAIIGTTEDSLPPKKRKILSIESEQLTGVEVPDSLVIDVSASASSSSAEEKICPSKKPQIRYDPEVPMTKEQAAAWRREQRRKRNRESAAASRQKQRDRCEELEEEVDHWKDKFEDAMKRLKKLESLFQNLPSQTTVLPTAFNKDVSIESRATTSLFASPHLLSNFSPYLSCVPVSPLAETNRDRNGASMDLKQEQEQKKHLNETISRPA